MTMTNYQIYFTDINGVETRTQTTFCSEALVHSFIESAIAWAKQIIFHGKPTEAFKSSEYVSLREICGKRSISWRILEVISGQKKFSPQDVSFDEEVMENFEDGELEYYVPAYFNTREILGEKAVPTGDGYISVYAYYDLLNKSVKDYLTIVVVDGDDTQHHYLYALDDGEKDIFLARMKEYDFEDSVADYEQFVKDSEPEWFIAYQNGYEYVQGDSFKDKRVNELLAEGYSKENIHVFPAESELK